MWKPHPERQSACLLRPTAQGSRAAGVPTPPQGQAGRKGALEEPRNRRGDIHCLFSAFCILSFSFSCGVSLGWGRGEEAREGVGVPELPLPTSSTSLGLVGAYGEGQAVDTHHEGGEAQGQREPSRQ